MADEAFSLFKEEMREDDTETRLAGMRKVKLVARQMGPDATRAQLLPALEGEPQ